MKEKIDENILKTSEGLQIMLKDKLVNNVQQVLEQLDKNKPLLDQLENMIKQNIPADHINNICKATHLLDQINKKIAKIEDGVTKSKYKFSTKICPDESLVNKGIDIIKNDFMDDIVDSLKSVNTLL